MTAETAVYRRVLRRETHSSRTAAAVVLVAALLVLVLAACAAGVWAAVDPLAREAVDAGISGAAAVLAEDAVLVGAGVVAVLVALLLLVLALAPGRRARRGRATDRLAVLVDDGVLADAVADAVAARCGVARRQVIVTMARRSARVRVTPTSGVPLDERDAERSAIETIASAGFGLRVRVATARRGVVA